MIQLIEAQAQLDALQPLFDDLHEKGGVLAVDTEFLREKTYNARLCLVQLGVAEDQYCVDVLAVENLDAIAALFSDPGVTKLLHAARQDMEVFWQNLDLLPKPVFDTQLAAAFCGMDLQIGHTALVLDRLGVELSKSQARTDWTRRPLSAAQVEYAAEDVAYLAVLHEQLLSELNSTGKYPWFEEELQDLYLADKYQADPAQAYQRLSGGALSLAQQYTLKDLAQWREKRAQERDIPRSWVLRDDQLYELAQKMPTSASEIIELGVFGRKSAARLAPQAAELIANVKVGKQPLWQRIEPLDKQQKRVISAMMSKLKELAGEHQIAQGLLATRRDLESLYRDRESNKLLSGWRQNLVGVQLLEIANRG